MELCAPEQAICRGMGTNSVPGTVATVEPGTAHTCPTAVTTATTDAILEASGVSSDMCPGATTTTSALVEASAEARGPPTTAVDSQTSNTGMSTPATTGAARDKQRVGTGDT